MKQQTAQTRTKRGTPDFQLLILTLLLVGFGLVMVFSSSSSIAIASESFNNDALYFTKNNLCGRLSVSLACFCHEYPL